MKVLAVDDHPDTAIALSMLFKLHGHSTRIAYDGMEALEMADDFRPDLIVMDVSMPKMDGLEACRRLRELPWGAQPTIIAVTAFGQGYYRAQTAAAGFDGHLVKPVDFDTIKQAVEHAHRKLVAPTDKTASKSAEDNG